MSSKIPSFNRKNCNGLSKMVLFGKMAGVFFFGCHGNFHTKKNGNFSFFNYLAWMLGNSRIIMKWMYADAAAKFL